MVIPINRVKLHTDFVGPLQSGLCKMLVIGLGNQEGCSTIHERAPEEFAAILEEAARLIMERVNVGFGIALIDNAYHKTAWVEAMPTATPCDSSESPSRTILPISGTGTAGVLSAGL